MLKKMRRRFISAAMAAFGTVMLLLAAGINLANYWRVTSVQDDIAASLMGYELRDPKRPGAEFPPIAQMPGGGPEAEFTTRFFSVRCDMAGNIQVISRDHIHSVDEETAREYTAAVLERNRGKGYYKDYRYRVSRDGRGIMVLFLNASHSLQSVRTLLLISLVTGVSSLGVVFGLVVFLSGYAVRPYEKNIRLQKQFITDAGHELKTPITSIATSADIAAMEHEGDEWIANIQKQTVRLSRLVADLVALSRLDEEVPFPEKSVFSLSEAVWETAEPFGVLAAAAGKRFHQNVEEGVMLRGDRSAVQRMLNILLDNAVRYSRDGGEIRLDVYRRRGRVHIEVFNTCSIPHGADLSRLFDRFYRLDASRASHTGGTGIGLSMAKAIAETHGGKIQAEGREGKTICFKVTI